MIIPEYFKDDELACPCGCGLMPDNRSIEMLYAFRMLRNKPVHLSSAARCSEYNKSIGGSINSYHMIGAFDIRTENPEEELETIFLLQTVGFTGIGINNNKFIHADRHHKALWTY